MQNELIEIMTKAVLEEIGEAVRKLQCFAVKADEVAVVTNREQLVICIRHDDAKLEANEDFVEIRQVPNIEADVLLAAIKETLQPPNLR